MHAGLGSSAEFRCVATAEPSPTLYWTRTPSSVLVEDSHVSFERLSNSTHEELVLRIRRVTQEHFGSYACFANNSINSTFKTAQVSGNNDTTNNNNYYYDPRDNYFRSILSCVGISEERSDVIIHHVQAGVDSR